MENGGGGSIHETVLCFHSVFGDKEKRGTLTSTENNGLEQVRNCLNVIFKNSFQRTELMMYFISYQPVGENLYRE